MRGPRTGGRHARLRTYAGAAEAHRRPDAPVAHRQRHRLLHRVDEAQHRRLQRRRSAPGQPAGGAVPPHARLPTLTRGEQAQRLVLQDQDRGSDAGQTQGQDRSREGQRHGRGRPHDERRLDPRRLHAGGGCHRRRSHPGCGRDHPRQVALRILLPVRRKPHQRDRARP